MNSKEHHVDKYIFIVCLAFTIALFVGGFFCPPKGVIDGSVLKAGGLLFGFAALGVAGQNLANGKGIKISKDDMDLTIEADKENEDE